MKEYTLYRRDPKGMGEFSCIQKFQRLDLEHDGIEAVWAELQTRVSTILTGVMYHPPNGLASHTKEICGMLEEVAQEGKEWVTS